MQQEVLSLIQKYMPTSHFRGGMMGNVLTKCPFHKGGSENRPSFSVNLEKGLFHCFTEGCPASKGGDIKRLLRLLGVARHIIDAETSTIQPVLDRNRQIHDFTEKHFFSDKDPYKADVVLPEALVGVYDHTPTALTEKGFDTQLLADMEIGYDKKRQRIMYPIRDVYGGLVGYSGGATISSQQPKYHVYEGCRKRRDGTVIPSDYGSWFDEMFPTYHLENRKYIWNLNRIYPSLVGMSDGQGTLFITEGFKACLWMIQSGFSNTVALMGSSLTRYQKRILERLGVTFVLCLDNDSAGIEAALTIGDQLWEVSRGKVMVMQYPEDDSNTQPDDYEPEGIREFVISSMLYIEHLNAVMRKRGKLYVPNK